MRVGVCHIRVGVRHVRVGVRHIRAIATQAPWAHDLWRRGAACKPCVRERALGLSQCAGGGGGAHILCNRARASVVIPALGSKTQRAGEAEHRLRRCTPAGCGLCGMWAVPVPVRRVGPCCATCPPPPTPPR
eukprot:4129093-Prymnesium_polylepis.1